VSRSVRALGSALLVLLAVGCGSFRAVPVNSAPAAESSAPAAPAEADVRLADRLDVALHAMDGAEFPAAHAILLDLARSCPVDSEIGYRARLLSASVDLDPRNSGGEIDRAAATLAAVLAQGGASDWTEPLAEALYLFALNLGAATPGAAEAVGEVATEPESPIADTATGAGGASGPGRIRSVVRSVTSRESAEPCGRVLESRSVAGRTLPELPLAPLFFRITQLEREKANLNEQNAHLDAEIERLEEELRRIRRTLIP
jgi:hypothetical protein